MLKPCRVTHPRAGGPGLNAARLAQAAGLGAEEAFVVICVVFLLSVGLLLVVCLLVGLFALLCFSGLRTSGANGRPATASWGDVGRRQKALRTFLNPANKSRSFTSRHSMTSTRLKLRHIASHYITPCHIASRHITSHHTTPHHTAPNTQQLIASHRIASHHIASHDIALHHITPHHTSPHHIATCNVNRTGAGAKGHGGTNNPITAI